MTSPLYTRQQPTQLCLWSSPAQRGSRRTLFRLVSPCTAAVPRGGLSYPTDPPRQSCTNSSEHTYRRNYRCAHTHTSANARRFVRILTGDAMMRACFSPRVSLHLPELCTCCTISGARLRDPWCMSGMVLHCFGMYAGKI